MALHNQLGKTGEDLAVEFLENSGYGILHRNWKYVQFEIDLIAIKGAYLHFIEVKTRSSSVFGHPEEAVKKKKFRFLQKAASAFLHLHPQYKHIQFDILSITKKQGQPVEYVLIQDVFL